MVNAIILAGVSAVIMGLLGWFINKVMKAGADSADLKNAEKDNADLRNTIDVQARVDGEVARGRDPQRTDDRLRHGTF